MSLQITGFENSGYVPGPAVRQKTPVEKKVPLKDPGKTPTCPSTPPQTCYLLSTDATVSSNFPEVAC